jgi:hypothetical protein
MRSQITPEALKRMKRRHLEYLAAHSGDVYYVLEPSGDIGGQAKEADKKVVKLRNLKLQENAFRATYELERRDRQKTALSRHTHCRECWSRGRRTLRLWCLALTCGSSSLLDKIIGAKVPIYI